MNAVASALPGLLLSESELLRKLNLTHFRAGKLRKAGDLVPDQTAQGGRMRLYRPERVSELAAKIHPGTAA